APPPSDLLSGSIHLATRPPAVPVVFNVSPKGSDLGDGSAAYPFATLRRAETAVRTVNRDHDVEVVLADGVYRLTEPLRFAAADGGQNGFSVKYEAAPGTHPILSGALAVNGWTPADP